MGCPFLNQAYLGADPVTPTVNVTFVFQKAVWLCGCAMIPSGTGAPPSWNSTISSGRLVGTVASDDSMFHPSAPVERNTHPLFGMPSAQLWSAAVTLNAFVAFANAGVNDASKSDSAFTSSAATPLL